LTFTDFAFFEPVLKATSASFAAFFLSISDNSENMSPPDICLPIEARAYFPSIVKLLLKIKLWKLGVFGIWQLYVAVGEAIEGFG
jgi:hypothetical protein